MSYRHTNTNGTGNEAYLQEKEKLMEAVPPEQVPDEEIPFGSDEQARSVAQDPLATPRSSTSNNRSAKKSTTATTVAQTGCAICAGASAATVFCVVCICCVVPLVIILIVWGGHVEVGQRGRQRLGKSRR